MIHVRYIYIYKKKKERKKILRFPDLLLLVFVPSFHPVHVVQAHRPSDRIQHPCVKHPTGWEVGPYPETVR